jgi:hypothetical protein
MVHVGRSHAAFQEQPMILTDLQGIVTAVVRRAQQQGFILPSEIREELSRTRISEEFWKEVVALAGPVLRFRNGRYYFKAHFPERLKEEQRQHRAIQHSVRQLVRQYKKSHALMERRQQGRTDFVQPVKVRTEDDRELTLLTRDISETGIRLIGTGSLLGHKVQVEIPDSEGKEAATFVVRILWTCSIGDEMFENGGNFLEVLSEKPQPLQLACG